MSDCVLCLALILILIRVTVPVLGLGAKLGSWILDKALAQQSANKSAYYGTGRSRRIG